MNIKRYIDFNKISGMSALMQWTSLVALSLLVGLPLDYLGIPASILLGTIICGIFFSAHGSNIQLNPSVWIIAQAILGSMIATMIPPSVTDKILEHGWMMFFGVASVVVSGTFISWYLARKKFLDASTLIWGLSPGAATMMIVMSEDYGADSRLVAFMQYLRIIFVVAVAAMVGHIYGADASGIPRPEWFGEVHPIRFAQTLAIIIIPVALSKLKSGSTMLIAIVVGLVFEHLFRVRLEYPRWFLAIAYALIGWRIGLRFTKELLLYATKTLPRMMACVLMFIITCAVLSVILSYVTGIDPLTAYLAMSPGGVDAIAIIAATCHVNKSFIMTMQAMRLLLSIMINPMFAKYLSKHMIKN